MMVTVSASAAANLMPRSGLIGNIVSNRKLLESSSNGLSGRIPPLSLQRAPVRQGRKVVSCQSALARERVPDMSKRVTMNLLLVGALSLPTAGLVGPYARFFVPAHSPSSMGGSLIARDEIGNEVLVTDWVKTYLAGSKSLVQGLKGDPTYLTVKEDLSLLDFGINAICTHMGCVVQWEGAENKFVCHCHGSQYDAQGKVIRGPAPLSLALAHGDNVDDKVVLSPWTEKDFRTDQSPWWT